MFCVCLDFLMILMNFSFGINFKISMFDFDHLRLISSLKGKMKKVSSKKS